MALTEQEKYFYKAKYQLFITKKRGELFVYEGVLSDKSGEKQEKA